MTLTTAAPTPTVPGAPLLGSLPDLRRDFLDTFLRAHREHGDVVRFQIGLPKLGRQIYAVFHPEAAHQIFGGQWQDYRKDTRFYSEIRDVIGDGLLTSQDDTWVRQKRFIQPLFTVKRVNSYAESMAAESARLATEWRASARDGGTLDVHHEMTKLTLRMVVRILFGEDADRVLPVVQSAFPVLGASAIVRAFSPIWLPLSWPTPVNRRARRAQAELFGACDEIIARRHASGVDRDDFLGMLLAARDGDERLSDQEVREQVLVFLLAGHETTSTALTFTLRLLGLHPEIQQRVRDEIRAVVGDREPTAADMRELSYTTMALKEAMRLFPSAPVNGRRSTVDSVLRGRIVPAGADIVTAPWVIHRHPDFWDDPSRFDPERFTPEREKARHRYAWFPFGAGPRACIGQHFSMLESVIALACLVRDYEFTSLPGEIPVEVHITLRPKVPVPIQIRPTH
ncbi:MAG: cytochrome P450 [Micromonosporaceae bacterium]|nr:cytochrome P450 [Micromonosporaceae bacterium]